MNKKKIYYWLLLPVLALMIGACGKSDDEGVLTPDVNVGETVTDFKKTVKYEDTKQFLTDRDAITGMMLNLYGIRWSYWRMVSNDFKNGLSDFFSVPPDETGKDTPDMLKAFNKIVATVYDNGETYDKALRNMSATGILPSLDDNFVTRGKASSTLSFSKTVTEVCKLSRQSVMAVMQKGGWTTDSKKLAEFYNSLPAEDRKGYNDPYTFWSDFSKGKLDRRAGQVFANLYYLQPLDFAITSREMKITPFTNTSIAAHKLATSAQDLILDAHPSVMAKMLNYGKDAHETVEKSIQLLKSTSSVVGIADKNDSKKFTEALTAFMMQMGHNVASYGPELANCAKNTGNCLNVLAYDNKSLDDFTKFAMSDFSDIEKQLFEIGSELYDLNAELLGDNLLTTLFAEGKKQGLNVQITFQNVGGNKYPMVILTDIETGKVRMGYNFDSKGNVQMLPGQGGLNKTVTVLNKKNKVVKKTIIVNENDPTIVECGLDDGDSVMEENPSNGYLNLDRKSMEFFANGGTLKTLIVTNYLYYSCSTKDKWITCSIPSDLNEMTVRVAANDSTAERKGQVTVMTTDSKGQVLKTVVLPVVQKGKEVTENYINASPSTLLFDAKGGKLSSTVSHSRAYNYVSADYDNSMAGWATVDVSLSGDDFVITVDATPNTTGKERTGMVTAFAAYNQQFLNDALNGNVDANNVLVTTIVVKQAANEAQEDGEEIKDAVRTVQFDFDVAALNDEGKNSTDGTSWSFDKSEQPEDVIKVTKKGKGIHVECSTSYKKAYSSEGYTDCSATLSFDVDDLGDAWMNRKTKVLNGKFKSNETDYYNGEKTSVVEYAIDFTNVPMEMGNWWKGETADGVKFSNFYSKRSYNLNHPETAGSSSYTFVDSPNNVINVICAIKPDIIYSWK